MRQLNQQVASLSLSGKKKSRSRKKKATPFADVGRTLGGSLGGLFGYRSPGAALGGLLGGYTGKIFGSGAYSMSRNSLWTTGAQVPVMHSSNESVTFKHREYIGDVTTSTAFSVVNTFNVNPGDSICFPYLSGIARNFQEYEFSGLVFEFKSTSADAVVSTGTSTAMGTIALAAQYDLLNAVNFSSKVEMLNEMWAVDGKPSINHFLPIECAPKNSVATKYNVRVNNVTSDPTRNELQDLCRVDVGAVGSPGAYNIGELYVSYDVTLFKPRKSALINTSYDSHYVWSATGVSDAAPLGMVHTHSEGLMNAVVTSTYVTVPVTAAGGTYQFVASWLDDTTVTWVCPSFSLVNATYVAISGESFIVAPPNSGVTSIASVAFTFSITDPTQNASIVFQGDGTVPHDKVMVSLNRCDPSIVAF